MHHPRRPRSAFFVLSVLLASPHALGQADTTTTAQILANTASAVPSCASWRVSGTCFWLRCGFWSCSVHTSLRVSHYNSDAVVSAFHDDALHPWRDAGRALARGVRGAATGLVGQPIDSAGTRTRDDRRDRARMFRDVDVIGHPAGLLSSTGAGGNVPMVCPTTVQPLQPYFSSYLDALVWRSLLPVEWFYPASFVPGLREIGDWPANSWGAVHPRDGNVAQQHPVKAAAVLAQRAGDITTRGGQPHVYLPLPTGGQRMVGNSLVWMPPPLVERDISTGKWQMLAPQAQGSCEVFGVNDGALPASWGDGRTSGSGGYAFNLWRPYSCCSREGNVFLGAVTF